MGMSFAVVSLARAAEACQPSRHQVRSSGGRSLSQRDGILRLLWIRLNWNETAQIADERRLQAQGFVRMIFTGQADASGSHFTDDLSVDILAQGYKSSYVGKRGKIPVLICLQDGDHMASLSMQSGEELGGHTLTVHDHSRDLAVSRVLFILLQKCGDAHSEMLVSAVGGHEQGMALLVMPQQERSAAQDHAQTPDQSAREEHVTVDGFAMAIHITGQRVELFSSRRSFGFFGRMPEMGGPAREGIGPAFGTIVAGDLR